LSIRPALPTPYFLARPRAPARAGLVAIMEGNGMSWQLLRVCERLAAEGYLTIAPDVFHRLADGHGVWEEAYKSLRDEDALSDIRECAALLRGQGVRDVGILGFCMGGRLSYLAAVSGVDLQAAAPFYGSGIDKLPGEPSCPLLAFFGARDEYVPAAQVDAVRKRHPRDVIVYPEAGHGFMRDGSDSYHEPSARDAWKRLLDFLAANLGTGQRQQRVLNPE
jgi:carboxymethylenebutenolidase